MAQTGDRYSRHVLLAEFGEEGQAKIAGSSVLVVGCGALGSNIAGTLARAGVGTLRIVDRDVIETSNLQRQTLFDERDVAGRVPKAQAAARRIGEVNSDVTVEALVRDVTPRNIEALIEGMDLVMDGLDNPETRYVLNDACVKHRVPWIYGGVLGMTGMTMSVFPGDGPCLRCVFPDPPPTGSLPTCDTMGVLNSAPAIIANLQVTEAYKILLGLDDARKSMLHMDLAARSFREIEAARDEDCPCCSKGRFEFLDAERTAWVTSLCGRDAVQISPADDAALDLEQLAVQLGKVGDVSFNGFLLDFCADALEMTVFPDGRVIVKGTPDEAVARTFHARYLGA